MGGSQCDNDSSVITKLLVSYGMRQSFRLVNPMGVVQNSKGGTPKLIFSQTYSLVYCSLNRVLMFQDERFGDEGGGRRGPSFLGECESESRLSFGTFLLFGESLSVLDQGSCLSKINSNLFTFCSIEFLCCVKSLLFVEVSSHNLQLNSITVF